MDRKWFDDLQMNNYFRLIAKQYTNCLVLDTFFLVTIQNLNFRSSYLTLCYIIY